MGKMFDALKKAEDARPREEPTAAQAAVAALPEQPGETARAAERPTAVTFGTAYRGDADPRLLTLCEPHGAHAEQYRALRTNLMALAPEQPTGLVVVTSAVPGEGKSVSSANLACALAEEPDRKVALVDADMRKPTIHKLMGLDGQRGLSDYLAGGTMLEMVIQRCRLPNLWVLPAGRLPPNPSELLGSRRLDDLLSRLRRDYDYVVIDMPPVASTTDPGVVAPKADGVVLVVRMGQTPREISKRAVEQLRKARANILGLLLTDVVDDGRGYYSYAYEQQAG